MKFEWDGEKSLSNIRKHGISLSNIRKHGIDFADIWRFFENDIYMTIDDRFDYGEIRYLSLCLLFGEVIAVSYSETNEITRIISARKAEKYEQETYFREIRN